MKVLSNREIYVLLKLLKGKESEKGSIANVEIDKNFTLEEIKHIQEEISLSENKALDEIFSIENTYKKMLRMEIHIGYKISIIDIEALTNYSLKYVKALAQNELSGLSENENLSTLMKEFYSTAKDKSALGNHVVEDMKYMPVVLFAHINNLIEIRKISNSKYDLRNEVGAGVFRDDMDFKGSENTVKITIEMNMEDFCKRMAECMSSGEQEIKIDIRSIFANPTIVDTKASSKKPRRTQTNSIQKERYHMRENQWKVFMCLLKTIQESNFPVGGEGEIQEQYFINNGIFNGNLTQHSSVITRFNDDYNKIVDNSAKDYEKILEPKISGSSCYVFNVSKIKNLFNLIKENSKLRAEFKRHEGFLRQLSNDN